MNPLFAVLFIAALAEGLTEYLARPIVEGLSKPEAANDAAYTKPLWLRYVAALVGIGLAIVLRADLFAAVGLTAINPWIAYVLTGILAGRGSNYVHDLVDTWRSAQP